MFKRTRLKLTGWYVLMVMLVSIFFSVIIFEMLSIEVDRFAQAQQMRFERRLHSVDIIIPPPIVDLDLVSETKHRIILNLIVVNSTILLMSAAIGFFLSGVTLKPIAVMLDEQNRFISDSSHELRTPLTSLKSAFEVSLRDKNLTVSEARNIISESIEEVNKLQSLSDSLLQLAQYEKPNGHSQFEKINLQVISQKVIDKLTPVALSKKIKVINKIESQTIIGNPYGINDLFVIILDNAIKYTSENKKIILTSSVIKSKVIIKLIDQGIGISPEDLPRIFDRFYRADTARTKENTKGYGLGLSIAKKIVDTHHGSIIATSELNKGTTFIVKLPINNSVKLQ